jgi:hypothetical protein
LTGVPVSFFLKEETSTMPDQLALDRDLRRQATQVAMQLPEDRDQALSILAYARELVDWLNTEPQARPTEADSDMTSVVLLRRGS